MYKKYFKRLFDFCGAFVALCALCPFLLIVSIWLSVANKGAGVFFFQQRPGKNEEIFKIIKFKSMNDETDENGKLLPDRVRLTKAGAFVRKMSIDELPQLINVLKGDMSFIGPRPLLVRYLPFYTEREKLRHSVRPGITGWAQINGRNKTSWNDKLEYDAYYAENISFLFDVKIFFLTIYKVLKHDGVVENKKEHYLDEERKEL